jgi:hypothetical protein
MLVPSKFGLVSARMVQWFEDPSSPTGVGPDSGPSQARPTGVGSHRTHAEASPAPRSRRVSPRTCRGRPSSPWSGRAEESRRPRRRGTAMPCWGCCARDSRRRATGPCPSAGDATGYTPRRRRAGPWPPAPATGARAPPPPGRQEGAPLLAPEGATADDRSGLVDAIGRVERPAGTVGDPTGRVEALAAPRLVERDSLATWEWGEGRGRWPEKPGRAGSSC